MASLYALRLSPLASSPLHASDLPSLRLRNLASQSSLAQSLAGHGNYAGLYRLSPCNAFKVAFLLFLLPALVFLSCAVKLTSAGPVLVCTECRSHTGKVTRLFRFRTTYVQNPSKLTLVGRLLHRLALDRLPMLWNTWEGA